MELILGAKGTKPGSKATAKNRARLGNARPPRVPTGTLHYIDVDDQSLMNAMFVAVCGEGELVSLQDATEENFDNEMCPTCSERKWAVDFDEAQKTMLS